MKIFGVLLFAIIITVLATLILIIAMPIIICKTITGKYKWNDILKLYEIWFDHDC